VDFYFILERLQPY